MAIRFMSKRAWKEKVLRYRECKERAQKIAQERLIRQQERDIELDGAE